MEQFQVRTDLALEARERFEEDVEIRGVSVEERYDEKHDIRITKVCIESENGAKAMGKPVGVYITLEAPKLSDPDKDYHREVSETLAIYLQELLGTDHLHDTQNCNCFHCFIHSIKQQNGCNVRKIVLPLQLIPAFLLS